MGFDTRKQKFTAGQEVVLVRDLHIGDLDLENDRDNPLETAVILPKGTKAVAKANGFVDGTIVVQFSEPRSGHFHQVLSAEPVREDGRWSIDRDLIRPASQEGFVSGKEIIVPFATTTTTSLYVRNIPAGYKGKLIFNGVDSDGDVRVEGPSLDSEYSIQRFYMKWYETVDVPAYPAALSENDWYGFSSSNPLGEDNAIMVVFTREVTRAEIGSREHIEPASYSNRRMAYPGTVGMVRRVYFSDKKARVEWLDLSKSTPAQDFWLISLDAIAPLRNYETGEIVTLKEYLKQSEEDLGLYSVGDTAEVFLDVYETKLDDDGNLVIDEDVIDYAFRDGDEVYIIEVDAKAFKEDSDGLVYKISHNEDGTGQVQWVRVCDLNDPEND